jgi:NADH-quinone oxidoreductase subunit L
MTTEQILWLLPLPPLLAFVVIILFTNRWKALSFSIAVAAAAISWLGSMVVFFRSAAVAEFGKFIYQSSIPWLPTGDTYLRIGVMADPLTAITLFFVGFTVLMIFIYSIGYHNFGKPRGDHDRKGLAPHGATVKDEQGHEHTDMSVEPMFSRFFAFIGLFAFGMYTLVVSNNLLTLFVGWEIMGLCSYLLIGFWYAKPSARNAAIKAFLTTRVGDVFMLLGLVYLYTVTGTLNYREIFYNPVVLNNLAATMSPVGISVASTIAILIFIGIVGKSAQWPLHVWLPDAMEGPTPVSAMIHAATMVSAGVYLAIRIYPLTSAGSSLHHLTPAMMTMGVIGGFTAIFAATIAVAQNDIKKVLAYSTISQLGFMIAALGIGAYVAAAFHLLTHAFFKALLFLGSGSVIHGVEHGALHTGDHVDPQDMFNMGGLRKKMPITFWTFLIGGLALSGFPFITAGFWSKDEILGDAYAHGQWAIFFVLVFAATLTAFYTMRQITLTFFGQPRTKAAEHAKETPWTMTLPLVVLAVFAVAVGWAGIPEALTAHTIPNWFHEFVGGTLLERPEVLAFNFTPMLVSILISLGGLTLGWLVYRRVKEGDPDPLVRWLGPVHTWLRNKWYFDEFYAFFVVKPVIWISEVFTSLWMDRKVIDGILNGIGGIIGRVGFGLRNYFDAPVINGFGDFVGESTKWLGRESAPVVQRGRIQGYMIASMTVIIILAAAFAFFFLFKGFGS